MNATTWKYHPRRSPRKRVPSLAVRLAIAALGEYQKQIGANIEADSEWHRKVSQLVSLPGTIRIGPPMNWRFWDSGVVAITPEMEETMRPRTFSVSALDYRAPKGTA